MKRALNNKVIVITGASSGIGQATAIACGAQGMSVVVSARREDRLDQVAREVESAGGQALPLRCDVTQDDDVRNLIARTIESFGRLDALFSNAGYGIYESVERTTLTMFRDIFETNFFGTIRCLHEALPALRRTKRDHDDALAHLLICSSALSEIAIPMDGAYAATKAAQDSVAGALRAEVAAEGITVTSVHPIGTDTEFSKQAKGSEEAGKFIRTQSRRWRSHTPEVVARAILRGLQRPRPEVWPSPTTRLLLAGATAFPGLAARGVNKMMRGSDKHP